MGKNRKAKLRKSTRADTEATELVLLSISKQDYSSGCNKGVTSPNSKNQT